jgi:hypothetical protein
MSDATATVRLSARKAVAFSATSPDPLAHSRNPPRKLQLIRDNPIPHLQRHYINGLALMKAAGFLKIRSYWYGRKQGSVDLACIVAEVRLWSSHLMTSPSPSIQFLLGTWSYESLIPWRSASVCLKVRRHGLCNQVCAMASSRIWKFWVVSFGTIAECTFGRLPSGPRATPVSEPALSRGETSQSTLLCRIWRIRGVLKIPGKRGRKCCRVDRICYACAMVPRSTMVSSRSYSTLSQPGGYRVRCKDPRVDAWEATTYDVLDKTFGRPRGDFHQKTRETMEPYSGIRSLVFTTYALVARSRTGEPGSRTFLQHSPEHSLDAGKPMIRPSRRAAWRKQRQPVIIGSNLESG